MDSRRKGVITTVIVVGAIAIGVFIATIVLYNPMD